MSDKKNDAFQEANSLLESWVSKWLSEKTRTYTHCTECGKKLSDWERENHKSLCKSCADSITYGGPLGYPDMRL